jgi:hypothetical protein
VGEGEEKQLAVSGCGRGEWARASGGGDERRREGEERPGWAPPSGEREEGDGGATVWV